MYWRKKLRSIFLHVPCFSLSLAFVVITAFCLRKRYQMLHDCMVASMVVPCKHADKKALPEGKS
jgi:hypothetical protein